MEEEIVNEKRVIRNYKDTVFRMLFNSKKELLTLYNALNNTDYTKEEELEIVTLENAIYMTFKNDVSCLLDMNIQLFEQQASVNPNTPLRFLMYIARQLEKLIVKMNLYGSKLIKLPNPRFFVFYNGKVQQPEVEKLCLSSSYEHKTDEINLELKVLQLNINSGYNEEVKRKCPTLFQYMQYVDKVREYSKDYSLEEAVPLAVDYCIKHNILKDFLLANKAEVISMSIFEFDEELYKKSIREEGYEEGIEKGLKQGREESRSIIEQRNNEIKQKDAEIERLKKMLEKRNT